MELRIDQKTWSRSGWHIDFPHLQKRRVNPQNFAHSVEIS